ncbi:Hint domain-containing protein [Pararhodobacter sp. CCB-MM2]|uniref:Hint domain-containing protein n=1 Tax=Pararhodobacter sp. CCB-MM2 TaxID=1786003 RepID=UPI000834AFF1|nr:Hint domain-containing protein [Pararhodobacter sp. CCB-MM2]
MSSVSGFSGVYAVEWAQTAPGEEWGLPPDLLSVGMSWQWRGDAQRLDAGVAALWLEAPRGRDETRLRARKRVQRLAFAASESGVPIRGASSDVEAPRAGTLDPAEVEADPFEPTGDAIPDSFSLTDGRRVYTARIVRLGARLLAVFAPMLPPPDVELWVAQVTLETRAPRRAGVICFLPGTMIATPDGPRAVEDLRPGEDLSTRDNGAQPLVWKGETRLSGAELFLHPHLRPIRIAAGALPGGRPDEDLLVSPSHRLLLPAPGCLQSDEVLVAAEDLEDGRGIRRDYAPGSVRYIHLMLESHEILSANGVPCESFHPGLADAQVLQWHARSLERAMPGLAGEPARYGEPARRCLSRGEAGILRAELA